MALLAWSMLPHRTVDAVTAQETVTYRIQADDPQAMTQHIATAHLFGQDAAMETPATVAVDNVSISGIIYSDDKDSALAILEIGGDSKVFRIGDALPDGEKLLSIAPAAIELGGAGTSRVIALQRYPGDATTQFPMAGDAYARDATPPGAQFAGGSKPYLKPVELLPGSDPLSQLRSLRQQLIPQRPGTTTPHAAPAKHPAKP